MITIYHAPGTRSVRPIWLCYELGLEFDIQTIPFTPEYLASTTWRSISPAGKLPILRDGDLTMFESGAMMEYILEKYGNGRMKPAPGTSEAALHHQWSWFSEATLSRPLGINRLLRSQDQSDNVAEVARSKIEDCLQVVEAALTGQDYLLGEFYAADIMMGYSLELTRRFGILDECYPATLAYLQLVKDRPACKKAMSA